MCFGHVLTRVDTNKAVSLDVYILFDTWLLILCLDTVLTRVDTIVDRTRRANYIDELPQLARCAQVPRSVSLAVLAAAFFQLRNCRDNDFVTNCFSITVI